MQSSGWEQIGYGPAPRIRVYMSTGGEYLLKLPEHQAFTLLDNFQEVFWMSTFAKTMRISPNLATSIYSNSDPIENLTNSNSSPSADWITSNSAILVHKNNAVETSPDLLYHTYNAIKSFSTRRSLRRVEKMRSSNLLYYLLVIHLVLIN